MLVDLHIHTWNSDGTMSVEEVLKNAKEKGGGIISITDHNSIKAYDELENLDVPSNIKCIKGVELTVKYKEETIHLLAYNFVSTEKMVELIHRAYNSAEKRDNDLIKNMSKTMESVSVEEYEKYEYDKKDGGCKTVHYLQSIGITKNIFDGFKCYKDYGCRHRLYDYPELREACKIIKEAGGYSVLAHPGKSFKKIDKNKLIDELEVLLSHGIDGIECYYPTHSNFITDTCLDFCINKNIIITCGSDEHGEFIRKGETTEKHIGCMNVSLDKLEIIKLLK